MKNLKKGSSAIALSIIIVILLLVIGYLLFKKSPDVTIEEPTLTNSQNSLSTSSSTSLVTNIIAYSGSNFSLRYPSNWIYLKFSCNTDGVAFWPENIAPDFSKGSPCSANSFIESAPIILDTTSTPKFELRDAAYKNILTEMEKSLTDNSLDKTKDWKTYNSGQGFSFKYPPTFFLDNENSTAQTVVFGYNDQGERYFSVGIQPLPGGVTLEEQVKKDVADMKVMAKDAATPVTVSYKAATIGSSSGFLIKSEAGDVLHNTNAVFKTQKGTTVFSFGYGYAASDIAPKNLMYDQIQTIISTFK